MKNKLGNRGVAALIMIVVILLSTFLSANVRLNNKRNNALEVFRNGTGKNDNGIAYCLESRLNSSYSLLAVAKRYCEDSDPSVSMVTDARDRLFKTDSICEKFRANVELTQAVYSLYLELGNKNLSEADSSYRESLYRDFEAAGKLISASDYNDKADEFNAIIGRFPANFFAMVSFIKPLERFEG